MRRVKLRKIRSIRTAVMGYAQASLPPEVRPETAFLATRENCTTHYIFYGITSLPSARRLCAGRFGQKSNAPGRLRLR